MHLWSTVILFEIYNHVSNCSFDPLSSCSNLHFWSGSSNLKMDQKYKFVRSMIKLSNSHFWTTFKLFELDQKCRFKQFESGPKLQFVTRCYISKRITVDQKCICEANWIGDTLNLHLSYFLGPIMTKSNLTGRNFSVHWVEWIPRKDYWT